MAVAPRRLNKECRADKYYCQVSLPCLPPEGHPAPEVTWKKDGGYLNITDKVRSQELSAGD